MLGTGPLIVPPVFLEAGIGLGIIFCVIIGFFSYMAAEYVVESMSISNALAFIRNQEVELSMKSMSINEDDIAKTSELTEQAKKKIQDTVNEKGQTLFDFQSIIEYSQ